MSEIRPIQHTAVAAGEVSTSRAPAPVAPEVQTRAPEAPTPPLPPSPTQSVCASATSAPHPSYRFARDYSTDAILASPEKARAFAQDYLKYEARYFAQARHPETGLTYDGLNLVLKTGEVDAPRPFSAPSKESLDIGLCLKALEGDADAARVVGRGDVATARRAAAEILQKKLATYLAFERDYPGYGGMLPWFKADGGPLRPTDDWAGDAPGLDNGEWLWSLLTAESVLRREGFGELAEGYAAFNARLRSRVVDMFYDAEAGKVRADVHVVDPSSPASAYETIHDKPGRMSYLTGEHGVHEGMMLVLYLSLFGKGLTGGDKDRIWDGIRMRRLEHPHGTTWEGYWGSAHESWAYLFLPLRDLVGYRDLFRIREKIRTQNAVEHGYPGLATSTNAPGDNGWVGYLDGAGIEGVGSQPIRNNHVYAVYGAFPLLLQFAGQARGNQGLAWLANSLQAPKAQGPMGGGESGDNAGHAISPIKTVDGTFPNLLAMLGGLERETADMLREQGLYDAFVARMQGELDETFGAAPLREPSDFAAPEAKVPTDRLEDYLPSAPLLSQGARPSPRRR